MQPSETPATETRLTWEAPVLIDLGDADDVEGTFGRNGDYAPSVAQS